MIQKSLVESLLCANNNNAYFRRYKIQNNFCSKIAYSLFRELKYTLGQVNLQGYVSVIQNNKGLKILCTTRV